MTASRGSVADKGRFRKVKKLMLLLTRAEWRRALRKEGVAAAVEHLEIALPQAPMSVIDVGAHHGQFALFARSELPEATIYCIEPLPDAAAKLRRVFADDDAVVISESAAGFKSGKSSMHVSRMTDSSSLLAITDRYVEAFPGTEEASEATVDVRTLDDLIPAEIETPVFMKIDVQGGELAVLQGAEVTLEKCDMVYVECSFVEFYSGQALADEVISYLLQKGMRLRGAYSIIRNTSGECLQADLLFERRQTPG